MARLALGSCVFVRDLKFEIDGICDPRRYRIGLLGIGWRKDDSENSARAGSVAEVEADAAR